MNDSAGALPLILFEDTDLLVVNKPPGWNTHAPAPYAGEGIYEWLRHRERRWESLAILHRLDKETSGVMVFGKTPEANRSLTGQFARREVHKTYVLVTDREPATDRCAVRTTLVRVGDRYEPRPLGGSGDLAETHFRRVSAAGEGYWMEAEPVTGRTHQIRVHAAHQGWPLLGDPLYGGSAAARLHLHAARLALRHPRSGELLEWTAAPDFLTPAAVLEWTAAPDFLTPAADQLRSALISPEETQAWRVRHGSADRCPGSYVDRLGDWHLVQGESERSPDLATCEVTPLRGMYFKRLHRQVRQTTPESVSPRLVAGEPAPTAFRVRENGIEYEMSFAEGYSVGLFLDQRDNRRRWRCGHVAAGFPLWSAERPAAGPPMVLNTFAYTCAFSVAAALGGARTTSLDLSRKYLDWGRRNFAANGLDPAAHDFIYGDAFDWMERLARKGRRFDGVILDPPTFSRSRERGDFRVESDYGALVATALPLLAPEGVLLASTNAARWRPELFLADVRAAVARSGRTILQEHYVPQPPDFPVHRDEPAYLKTVWLRLGP